MSAPGPDRPWAVAKATAFVLAARPARGPAERGRTQGAGGPVIPSTPCLTP